jgi:hypothetical protein
LTETELGFVEGTPTRFVSRAIHSASTRRAMRSSNRIAWTSRWRCFSFHAAAIVMSRRAWSSRESVPRASWISFNDVERWGAVESVLEDGGDVAVGAGADIERATTRRPRRARHHTSSRGAEHARHERTVAVIRMAALGQKSLSELPRAVADGADAAKDALRRPLCVHPRRGRHALRAKRDG